MTVTLINVRLYLEVPSISLLPMFNLCAHVHYGIIHSQDKDTAPKCLSTGKRKENGTHTHTTEYYLAFNKRRNAAICVMNDA